MLIEREEELNQLEQELVVLRGMANKTSATGTTNDADSSNEDPTNSPPSRTSSTAGSGSGEGRGSFSEDPVGEEESETDAYCTNKGERRMDLSPTYTGNQGTISTADMGNATDGVDERMGQEGGQNGDGFDNKGDNVHDTNSTWAAAMMRNWEAISEHLRATEVAIRDLPVDETTAATTFTEFTAVAPPGAPREEASSTQISIPRSAGLRSAVLR